MVTLRKLALFSLLSVAALGTASCNKRDANLETDYNQKKASADQLVGQITAAMAPMKTEHQQWMVTLDQAAKKPGADTSKINGFRQDMQKHDADGQQIMALIDSVKMYSNVTPDKGDAFKAADDRLGTNFNDLNDKWKSYQDNHTKLEKDIQQFAVTTAGNAVADTAKAASATTTNANGTKSEAPATKAPASSNAHETANHHSGGAAKTTSNSTSATTPAPATNGAAHETVNHHTGGAAKKTAP